MKRNWLIAGLFILWVILACSIASAETVVLSFTGERCPYCRALERTWTDAGVQAELTTAKAKRTTFDTGAMTQAQLDGWKINGIPVTIVGERLDDGSVRELRRLDGATTAENLRAFIRGAK